VDATDLHIAVGSRKHGKEVLGSRSSLFWVVSQRLDRSAASKRRWQTTN